VIRIEPITVFGYDATLDPDERLMRSIEEQIGISENGKKAFREEILIRISSYSRKGRKFEYGSHDRTPNETQLKKVNEVMKRLIDEHGYCSVCANELLRYVGSLLNR
jgi:serine protein kinase